MCQPSLPLPPCRSSVQQAEPANPPRPRSLRLREQAASRERLAGEEACTPSLLHPSLPTVFLQPGSPAVQRQPHIRIMPRLQRRNQLRRLRRRRSSWRRWRGWVGRGGAALGTAPQLATARGRQPLRPALAGRAGRSRRTLRRQQPRRRAAPVGVHQPRLLLPRQSPLRPSTCPPGTRTSAQASLRLPHRMPTPACCAGTNPGCSLYPTPPSPRSIVLMNQAAHVIRGLHEELGRTGAQVSRG